MIYLDNAATTFPKAPGVSEAMVEFLETSAANPGRAGHRLSVAAEEMLDSVRLKITKLIDGEDYRRCIFTFNGTDSLNIALKGVLPVQRKGKIPHVITTVLEHNSLQRPLEALSLAGQIKLTRVDCDDAGFVSPDDIEKEITPNTALVAVTHASNVLGSIQDISAIGQIARKYDVLFLVDAAQTVGLVPISIREMNIDLLAFPGHKSLYGPTGTGCLYVGERCPEPTENIEERNSGNFYRPFREGGTGGDSATGVQPGIFPYYLEGGTPNTVGIAGLFAALDYLLKRDAEDVLLHERKLIQNVIDRLSSDPRFILYGPPNNSHSVGTLCLNLRDFEPEDVGGILDDSFEIAVRSGLHCAPYVHRRIGTYPNGALRISPGEFNTEEEIELLIGALDEIAGAQECGEQRYSSCP